MKKLLAILLAVVMTASMLAVCVSADNVVGGSEGVTTFETYTTTGHNLNVQVTDVTHKYAVDVTFAFDNLVIGGTLTWNADTMKYDVGGTTLTDTQRTVAISNRSDLPVYAYAEATDADTNDFISVVAVNTAGSKLTVAKATAGSGGNNGTFTTENLIINVNSTDWGKVAEYYAAKKLADESVSVYKIATVTVTISKD